MSHAASPRNTGPAKMTATIAQCQKLNPPMLKPYHKPRPERGFDISGA